VARVKFNPSAATKGLKKRIKKATGNKQLKAEYGEFLTERIRFQARKGRPLNDNGRFPKLKPSTVESRRNYRGRKHPAFSPAKSNLTITGQLQDAIKFKRKRSGLFELFVDNSRRKGRGEPNNRELSSFLEKIGFTLFSTKGLKKDKKIPRRLKQLLLRFLRKQLRKK